MDRKLPRVTEEAEQIRTSRAACFSMGKSKQSYSHPTPELSSAVLEGSAPPLASFCFNCFSMDPFQHSYPSQ